MTHNLCWLRRDLRLHDHAALSHALENGKTSVVFVFDTVILDKIKNKNDSRLTFIMDSLLEMEVALQKKGASLHILYGDPTEEIPKLAEKLKVTDVFCNRDYEPYAKERDQKVEKKLNRLEISFHHFKDQVMFEKHEVLNGSGEIYKVFTPYKNKWLETFDAQDRTLPDFKCNLKNLVEVTNKKNVIDHDWYKDIGFFKNPPILPGGTKEGLKLLKRFKTVMSDYKKGRDYPALDGTSLLSVHIRFGTISIRDMVRLAISENNEGAKTWLSELVWRDFYEVILDSNPRIIKESYKPEYDQIKWLGKPEHFKAWCEGQTGFPIVDAAMRCFNMTGRMHNRLRMITASFLCKILLVNWRLGEEYFADGLLDYDLAANNGGWQWSSSSGCDAQPYFRIFNPYTQSKKFDPEGEFIKVWCPELKSYKGNELHHGGVPNYPAPIVDYSKNRERALQMYSVIRK